MGQWTFFESACSELLGAGTSLIESSKVAPKLGEQQILEQFFVSDKISIAITS